MKTKNLLFCAFSAAILAVSCNDKKTPQNTGYYPLTPEDNRSRLQQIAMDVMAAVDPEKQADLLGAVDDFSVAMNSSHNELYDEVTAGSGSEEGSQKVILTLMSAAKEFAQTGNAYAADDIAEIPAPFYTAYYGIYEWTATETDTLWTKTGDSDNITIKYPASDKSIITVTASASAETSTISPTLPEDDPEASVESVTIPNKINASITKGSSTLFTLAVDGTYNLGGTLRQTITMNAGSYDASSVIDASNSVLSVSASFSVDGNTLLAAGGSAAIGDLNSQATLDTLYYSNSQDSISELGKELSDMAAYVRVMDLNIGVTFKDSYYNIIQTFSEGWDKIDKEVRDKYEPDDRTLTDEEIASFIPYYERYEYLDPVCNLYNQLMSITANYTDAEVFADLLPRPIATVIYPGYDTYYHYWYNESGEYQYQQFEMPESYTGYTETVVLKFRDDGQEIDLETYFTEDEEFVTNITDTAVKLMEAYMTYLPNLAPTNQPPIEEEQEEI